jgi:putative FmdB family regulatory protein
MPTYEYRCKECGHEFELFQSMSEAVKRKCPKCGKNALERLIGTGAAVLFKGGGFYETDYRSESYKKAAKAEAGGANPAPSDKPAADKPDKKTEAKPAEKKPDKSTKGGPKSGDP